MLTRIEKIFARNRLATFILNKSRYWYPPGFEGVSVFEVLKAFHAQVKLQGLKERAAAISYNFIMAIPPSFLFLFTLVPHLPFVSVKSIKLQLHSLIYDIIPSPQYNSEVIRFVDTFIDGSKIGLLSFSLLLSLFFASNAMMGLMRAFNKKYFGFTRRKGISQRWIAIKLTFIVFGLLLTYLILLIMQGAILNLIVSDSGWREVIRYTRWVFIILLIYFIIAFIFKYAPAVQKRWKILSPGTFLATMLSIISSLGFAIFVDNFGRFNALYGSIGTIMMLMALIFINSLALLIGFELNVSIKSASARKQMQPVK